MKRNSNATILAALMVSMLLVLSGCGNRDNKETVPESAPPAATDTTAPEPTVEQTPEQSAAEEPSEPEPEAENTPTEATEQATTEEEEAYPPPSPTAEPAASDEEVAYPPPVIASESAEEQAYPPPVTPTVATSSIPIVPFILNRPLEPGATTLTGTGPADVPILAVNVTLMGEVLGQTIIDSDGNFSIDVPELEESAWIGIALNDLDGTELTFDDFRADGFRGEGAFNIPQVGFVYDSATVGN